MDEPGHGALCYAEIKADDVERAKAFYAEVFGWTYQDAPDMSYTFFDSGPGGLSGGFMPRGPNSPPHPVAYMMCDDLEAMLESISNNGGQVLMGKTEFGGVGWLAHAADTEGNLIGVWQSSPDG